MYTCIHIVHYHINTYIYVRQKDSAINEEISQQFYIEFHFGYLERRQERSEFYMERLVLLNFRTILAAIH